MSLERITEYFRKLNMEDRISVFDVSSATVDLAAEALGVQGALICKTLSFKGPDDTCILVQAAGDTKIDNHKFKETFGLKAKMLSGDEVYEYTGFRIGGVCAFDITNPDVKIYVDESVKRFEYIYPACGSSNSAVRLTPGELFTCSKAISFVDVCKLKEE